MTEESPVASKSLSKVDKLLLVIRQEPGIASLALRSRAAEFDMKPDDVSQGLFVLAKQQRIRYGAGQNGTTRNRPCFAAENVDGMKAKIGRPSKKVAESSAAAAPAATPEKKKIGRPLKKAAETSAASAPATTSEKKKLGRPKKVQSLGDAQPEASPSAAQPDADTKPPALKKSAKKSKAPPASKFAKKSAKTKKAAPLSASAQSNPGHATALERMPHQNTAPAALEGMIVSIAEKIAGAFAVHVGQHLRAQLEEKIGNEVSSALAEAMDKLSSSVPQLSQHRGLAHSAQGARPALAAPRAKAVAERKKVVIIGVREKFAERIRSEFAGEVDMAFITPSETPARLEELLSQADEVVTLPKAAMARNMSKMVRAHRGFSEIGTGVAALRQKLRTLHA